MSAAPQPPEGLKGHEVGPLDDRARRLAWREGPDVRPEGPERWPRYPMGYPEGRQPGSPAACKAGRKFAVKVLSIQRSTGLNKKLVERSANSAVTPRKAVGQTEKEWRDGYGQEPPRSGPDHPEISGSCSPDPRKDGLGPCYIDMTGRRMVREVAPEPEREAG